MHGFPRRPFDVPERLITPEPVWRQRSLLRREFLVEMGLLAAGSLGLLAGCGGSDEEVRQAGEYEVPLPASAEPPPEAPTNAAKLNAPRNSKFEYGRPESLEAETLRFTNFYEFTRSKASWRYVDKFQPLPWQVRVDGLCRNPTTFDLDDLAKSFPIEERRYRHRCVETWAMCVPWSGFPLRDVLKTVDPLPEAKFVRFESIPVTRAAECPSMAVSLNDFPWPYIEGLTIQEAMNELTFLATGIYGHHLPKQNGAPVRVVIPWKYGFKGAKSIVRIKLQAERPETFWNTVQPDEYAFQANVDPEVPHPRWSQQTEWMLGTRERFQTRPYNGYGEYVAALY